MMLEIQVSKTVSAIGVCLALACALSFTGCAKKAKKSSAKPAPEFSLKDADGKTVHLSDYKGKVVLLDFWATWCGPCKIEIPWFIEFQQKYGKDGLQVLGVFVEDTLEKVKPYVVTMKMNYTILQGQDREDVQDAFGPMFGIPVTAVVSRDGKLCVKHTGLTSKDTFENEIKSLLDVPAATRTAREANP
jgi:thiol-disulfide isomerase/thioredoxin